uniref:5-bromo-4-chloroindolyl phosphate hydrolysis protein n=1 Tax=uncultured Thiotrichaceae bacterium TaxID=298394 RepID=A0A6S6SR53_9GAMM|nr:MAG: 5-bromo-4-chloroindolyl phosphate hydrolysis protein [uncultured Thiotrichaceae bacterium]
MSKAKRYNPTTQEAVHSIRYGLKGILLYLLPIPALIAGIISLVRGDIMGTLLTGGSFAAYMVAAHVARHGFKLEGEYKRRKIARAPKAPFKTVAATIIAVTTTLLATFGANYSIPAAVILGGAAFLGFTLYYGLDPRKDKSGNITGYGVSVEEMLEALESAEVRIKAIDAANTKINNPDYHQRLTRITDKARDILTSIEDDPTRLSRARKFLKVYLDGAQKVTESYVKSNSSHVGTTEALETDFSNVLNSIETTFSEQHDKLLSNDNFDLDVQIEVLEQQLKREGAF